MTPTSAPTGLPGLAARGLGILLQLRRGVLSRVPREVTPASRVAEITA